MTSTATIRTLCCPLRTGLSAGAEGSGKATTRRTAGSGSSAATTRSSNTPRGSSDPGSGRPPWSGMRKRRPRWPDEGGSSPFRRAGNVTSTSSGGSFRPRKVMAPARAQVSQPPPSQPAQARFLGSSSSIVAPSSSQSRGTRTRCRTSGPRGYSPEAVTRPRTFDTELRRLPRAIVIRSLFLVLPYQMVRRAT
jgi:hypothetical protein